MKKIPLGKNQFTLVDDEDFEYLNQWKWFVDVPGYAVRNVGAKIPYGKYKTRKMHKLIMKTPEGLETDHIDGNKLNNVRSNLRICTTTENKRNRSKISRKTSSKYKGVTWFNGSKNWKVYIMVDFEFKYLGLHHTEEEAALAYNKAAKKYHGKFAKLNNL